uniref:Methionyl-tRNA formyltransferase n=1 Tax=Candidatus Kentrum sp. TUN TaxID=2126343 RepID=A0A450ZBE6_9GAMM|nr:MAG: methionyl-tRNA formyltransferase [Candidatus Kentron sp. TUN]VFK52547.1 MAG: methionyl-tRNA formyltransferase [Candidatus Kentron sp. TUN]VFK52866.1 MAG: methionyl-tRNA formyltransferase [Candidatus Kentron sp. TUN]
MRIVFAGTPDFAAVILEALLETTESPNTTLPTPDTRLPADWSVLAVYTQPDRPVGRGRKLTSSPVKQLATYHCLPVYQPETCRDSKEWQPLAALKPDILVVAAYGLILPREVLEIPRYGCINVHASLLPRWRGAAPIQRAILAGDTETGVSIMRMDEGLDTGPVFRTARCHIDAGDTSASLHDRLAALGARTLIRTLHDIAIGKMDSVPQDQAQATYAKRITKSEGQLDWNRTAVELEHQVRAFVPWPVAFTMLEGKPLRVWESAVVEPSEKNAPGTITASPTGIDMATREGTLRLLTVQRPGARPVPIADFMRGYRKG